MKPSVIYLFVSPSGRAYAGRHTCQHEGWPRRGSGALPSGYRGSGKLWANVTRRHGPAIRWIILRRFGPDTPRADIDAAERRAIWLAQRLFGRRCLNVLEGGSGWTSEDARAVRAAQDADPAFVAERDARLAALHLDPSYVAQNRRHLGTLNSNPVMVARRDAQLRIRNASPEARAKNSAAQRAFTATPAGRSEQSRKAHIGNRKRRARKALAPHVNPPVITHPGATVWAYRPPPRLSVSVFR